MYIYIYDSKHAEYLYIDMFFVRYHLILFLLKKIQYSQFITQNLIILVVS